MLNHLDGDLRSYIDLNVNCAKTHDLILLNQFFVFMLLADFP